MLLIFPFKFPLLDLVTENHLKLWFIQLIMVLYIIILLFIFLSSSTLHSPSLPYLFQICVQFPFLSTSPRTISFKDLIELGVKGQSNSRSVFKLEHCANNWFIIRNGTGVSIGCTLISKPLVTQYRNRE